MHLYIVRHGEALSKEEDPNRALNEMGKAQAAKIGLFLQEKNQPVREIFHTSKERAKQTAEIIAGYFPQVKIDLLSALEPEEDVAKLCHAVEYFTASTLLVGHIPQVELLATYLLRGNPNPPIVAFETASIICFKKETSFWTLNWFVSPTLL